MTSKPTDRRTRITTAFGAAARYEDSATIQKIAAERLARQIAALPLPVRPTILELGCGTGFLTRAMAAAIGPARWTISDIAPEMVDRARAALAFEADYRVIDGEAVDPALGTFDLIVSNMAFQWFEDLTGAVSRLAERLSPGGTLAFSTMVAGSFAEWVAALADERLASGTPVFPDAERLAALAPPNFAANVEIVDLSQQQPAARDFLRGIRMIGAATPAAGYRPISGAALRRAMARFDSGPRIVTYRLGFCRFTRPIG